MKTGKLGVKYWVSSCGTGFVLFLFISFLSGNMTLEPVTNVLLLPGAALATLFGFGGHDRQGLALYMGGNLIFYCLLFLSLFRLLNVGMEKPPS